MKILVDTHVALWLFNDYENLYQLASNYLHDEENELYISIASAWEVAIKHSLGKLPSFGGGVSRFLHAINDNPIQIIGVDSEYVKKVENLPYVHRDPFDRIIIATALCEDMIILTADKNIQQYDVPWAW
ncbi:MAG: type II toxin-antitoxin system VapC family toxin [Defluviitaleaceae bacterium]|nr:type II toxin-antitoxin system VapC family toxin [Defluviitaleaceae bacterium]MCL2262573.1 type II toxin-antitoxin system VapC family toxin [Defluviitaleaceae bacterium]